MKKKYFEWTAKDHQKFKDTGNLDHGKWTFYYHEKNDEYEATMNGLYTHVFGSLHDMLYRDNEIDLYEYDVVLSEQRGEEVMAKELTEEEIRLLKEKHEKVRAILMDKGCEEYGDCIIDELSEVFGVLPTTAYYEEVSEVIDPILEEAIAKITPEMMYDLEHGETLHLNDVYGLYCYHDMEYYTLLHIADWEELYCVQFDGDGVALTEI